MDERRERIESNVRLTRHGTKRVSQRIGLPKKAVRKNAVRALKYGVSQSEARGKLRNYLNGIYSIEETANNLRVYNRYVYVFVDEYLITVLHVPKKFQDTADIQQQKKKFMIEWEEGKKYERDNHQP